MAETDDIPALVAQAEKVANYHALHGTRADAAFIRSLAAALSRLSREVAIEREAGVDARNSLRLADAAVDDLKARLATAERERDEAREALANVKNMGAWRKWDE